MAATPPRRRLSFSLRMLFVVVTASGLFAWWMRLQVEQLRERERLLQWARANGVEYGSLNLAAIRQPRPLPIAWRWLGAKRIDVFTIEKPMPRSNHVRLTTAFPEAVIVDYTQVFPDPPYSRPPGELPEIVD